MKYSEIISLSSEERRHKIEEESLNLRKMKFAHAITPLENPMQIKRTRRLLAKLKTAQTASLQMSK